MVGAYREGEIWSYMAYQHPHYGSRQRVVDFRREKPCIPNSECDICIVDSQVKQGLARLELGWVIAWICKLQGAAKIGVGLVIQMSATRVLRGETMQRLNGCSIGTMYSPCKPWRPA